MSVKDYRHQLNLEISENENRKDFTFSERLEYARLIEEDERLKADERMKSGKKIDPTQHVGEGIKGESNEITAQKSGFGSAENYRRAKYIEKHADEEKIKQIDEGEVSISKAYKELKEET